jgi:hypothetical protein
MPLQVMTDSQTGLASADHDRPDVFAHAGSTR